MVFGIYSIQPKNWIGYSNQVKNYLALHLLVNNKQYYINDFIPCMKLDTESSIKNDNYFMLGQVRFKEGPAGLEPPTAGAINRRKATVKIRGKPD